MKTLLRFVRRLCCAEPPFNPELLEEFRVESEERATRMLLTFAEDLERARRAL